MIAAVDVALVRRAFEVFAGGDRLRRELVTLIGQRFEAGDRHTRFYGLWVADLAERMASSDRAHELVRLELEQAMRSGLPSLAECLAAEEEGESDV